MFDQNRDGMSNIIKIIYTEYCGNLFYNNENNYSRFSEVEIH